MMVHKKIILVLALGVGVSGLAGCSTLEDWTGIEQPDLSGFSLPKIKNPFEKPPPKMPGERISVMEGKRGGIPELDVGAASQVVVLPVAAVNQDWTQPGGMPDNAPGHLAIAGNLSTRWSTDAGYGTSKRSKLTASPIVYAGRVFTLDSRGRVTAFSQSGGSKVWTQKLNPGNEKDYEGYGGGLAIDGGILFVATGFGKVYALNPQSGKEIWSRALGEPVRASPTAVGGKLFTTTVLGSFICLNGADGAVLWRNRGLPESASILSNASPAVAGGLVIAPYPSGEVIAYDIATGSMVWSETLSRTRSTSSLSALRNAARPVISNGVVYSVGHGGRMIASKLKSGERLWAHNIRGMQAPWVVGSTVYVVDVSGQLMALTARKGKLLWSTKLPGGGRWAGPVLASNKLWLVSTKGMLVGVDAKLGAVQSKRDIGVKMTIAPVVARGGMYILTDRAKLLALN